MTTLRDNLTRFLDDLMTPDAFADYGPNGLQVEGGQTIERIAFAVSATRDSIEYAAAQGADALIVHHGLLWKFHGVRPLVGPYARRLAALFRNEISLYAFHLPLDAHPEFGNAAEIARRIGMPCWSPFGDYHGSPTGVQGALGDPMSVRQLARKLKEVLDHEVVVASPDLAAEIHRVGIITGGANSGWQEASRAGLDAYITGEISEHDWHDAQEAGIHMFAGGHYATEQFGIQALMMQVARTLPVEVLFIPSDNPA